MLITQQNQCLENCGLGHRHDHSGKMLSGKSCSVDKICSYLLSSYICTVSGQSSYQLVWHAAHYNPLYDENSREPLGSCKASCYSPTGLPLLVRVNCMHYYLQGARSKGDKGVELNTLQPYLHHRCIRREDL